MQKKSTNVHNDKKNNVELIKNVFLKNINGKIIYIFNKRPSDEKRLKYINENVYQIPWGGKKKLCKGSYLAMLIFNLLLKEKYIQISRQEMINYL